MEGPEKEPGGAFRHEIHCYRTRVEWAAHPTIVNARYVCLGRSQDVESGAGLPARRGRKGGLDADQPRGRCRRLGTARRGGAIRVPPAVVTKTSLGSKRGGGALSTQYFGDSETTSKVLKSGTYYGSSDPVRQFSPAQYGVFRIQRLDNRTHRESDSKQELWR